MTIKKKINHAKNEIHQKNIQPSATHEAATPTARVSWQLVNILTQQLMQKLAQTLAEMPDPTTDWERLFGAKDSMVVNLQKLVQVLVQMSGRLEEIEKNIDAPDMADSAILPDEADLQMLKNWLEQELAKMENRHD